MRRLLAIALLTGCTTDVYVTSPEDQDSTDGVSIGVSPGLTGCHGRADASIPADGRYVLTTFGGPGDAQPMSCGGRADGSGWYAASRQRYGCGARVRVEAGGKCVVLATDDYGPDVCVEHAAGLPILDVSPRAARALFGTSGAGWSDHLVVSVTEVSAATPLGECAPDPGTGGGSGGSGGSGGTGGTTSASCASSTLDRDVADGTCVQAADDAAWYRCSGGAWVDAADRAGCVESYGFCDSATLGRPVPPRACVQSASTGAWYQCNGQGWVKPVDVAAQAGPIGACAEFHPR